MIDNFRRYALDTAALLGQVFLAGIDVARVGVDAYRKLIVASAKKSIFILALSLGLLWLSDFIGVSWIGAIGVLTLGALGLVWLMLATPVIAVLDSPSRPWDGLARISRVAFTGIIVIGLLFSILLKLPEGFSVSTILVFTLTVAFGSLAIGWSLTRPLLVAMLFLFEAVAMFAIVMPDSAQALMARLQMADSALAETIQSPERELVMDVDTLINGGPDAVRLYDKAGASLWWCRDEASSPSGFRCFSRAGIDPINATERFALTEETVIQAVENLTAGKARKDAELEAQGIAYERAITEREEAERVAMRNRLVNLPPTPLPVLLNIEEDGHLDSAITKQIGKALGIRSSVAFLQAAYDEGVVLRIRQGDPQLIKDLNLDRAARTLILGNVLQRFVPHEALAGAGRTEIQLNLIAIDTNSAHIFWRERFEVSELGHNQRIATELAQNELAKQVQAVIDPILFRRP